MNITKKQFINDLNGKTVKYKKYPQLCIMHTTSNSFWLENKVTHFGMLSHLLKSVKKAYYEQKYKKVDKNTYLIIITFNNGQCNQKQEIKQFALV